MKRSIYDYPTISNQQSAISNQQSAISNQQDCKVKSKKRKENYALFTEILDKKTFKCLKQKIYGNDIFRDLQKRPYLVFIKWLTIIGFSAIIAHFSISLCKFVYESFNFNAFLHNLSAFISLFKYPFPVQNDFSTDTITHFIKPYYAWCLPRNYCTKLRTLL